MANYYLELGSYNYKKAGNNAAAVAAAKKAAELSDEYKGKAYLLIGTIWGTVRCGGNEVFEGWSLHCFLDKEGHPIPFGERYPQFLSPAL